MQHVLEESKSAKYYAIIIDSTQDSSHVEQTKFFLRYLVRHESRFEIVERLLKFVDCSDKTVSAIAQMITETFDSHAILLAGCRAQGGKHFRQIQWCTSNNNNKKYKKYQEYPPAMFSPCGCHTLNLCGNDAAECTPEAITYLRTIRTIYTLFNCSPKRWKILAMRIGCLRHGISGTRWSDRVESVKPFVAHPPLVNLALDDLLELNLTKKKQERNPWSHMLCQFLHLHHNATRVVQNTGLY